MLAFQGGVTTVPGTGAAAKSVIGTRPATFAPGKKYEMMAPGAGAGQAVVHAQKTQPMSQTAPG